MDIVSSRYAGSNGIREARACQPGGCPTSLTLLKSCLYGIIEASRGRPSGVGRSCPTDEGTASTARGPIAVEYGTRI